MKNIFKLFLVLMGSMCLLSATFGALDNAEVSWSMDTSTSPVPDDSENSKTGLITGATHITNGALLGSGSYSFNGNDYISVNHNYNTQYLTSSIIIKPSSVTQGTALLMGQYDTAGKRAWKVDLNGDEIGLIITNGGVGACKNWITNGVNIIPNNIYQIDFTFDSGNPKIYVNGNEITSFTKNTDDSCGNNFFNTDVPTMIGGVFLSGNPTGQFNGVLDQFMIYNRVLSSEEITQKYLNNPYELNPNGIQTDIKEFYNSSNIIIQINTSNTGNLSYSLNNGTLTSICENCNTTNLSLNSLSEGVQSILFESVDENGAINTTQNFTIDTTNPTINNSLDLEINSYVFDLNFSCNDSNIDSCIIEFDDENKTSNDTTKTFTTNGNKTYTIYAKDLAGNQITETGVVFVNPYAQVKINDNVRSIFVEDFSFGTYTDDSGILLIPYYDLGLGTHEFEFIKSGYDTKNFSLEFTNSNQINTTLNVDPVSFSLVVYEESSPSSLITFDLIIQDSQGNIFEYLSQTNFSKYYDEMPTGELTLTIDAPNYDKRKIFTSISEFTTTSHVVYLENDTIADPVVFRVLETDKNTPIEDVVFNFKKIINGEKVSVAQAKTDAQGFTAFNMDIFEDYEIIITKNNYVTQTINTIPGKTDYTLLMYKEGTQQDYTFDSVSYKITPETKTNEFPFNASVIVVDDLNLISSLKFQVITENGTLSEVTSTNAAGATLTIPVNEEYPRYTLQLTIVREGKTTEVQKIVDYFAPQNQTTNIVQVAEELEGEESNANRVMMILFIYVIAVILGSLFSATFGAVTGAFAVIGFAFVGWIPPGIAALMIVITIAGSLYFQR